MFCLPPLHTHVHLHCPLRPLLDPPKLESTPSCRHWQLKVAEYLSLLPGNGILILERQEHELVRRTGIRRSAECLCLPCGRSSTMSRIDLLREMVPRGSEAQHALIIIDHSQTSSSYTDRRRTSSDTRHRSHRRIDYPIAGRSHSLILSLIHI